MDKLQLLAQITHIRVYEEIKSAADKVVYTSEEYHSGCMHKRNRHLIDHSGTCVAFLKNSSGGTKYTVDKRQRRVMM